MFILNFVPLIIMILFLAKWERDKKMFDRDYSKAYINGVKDGWEQLQEDLRKEFELKCKKSLNGLDEKYELGVKVIKVEDCFHDVYTGKSFGLMETKELPTLGLQMSIRPNRPIYMFANFHKWKSASGKITE